MKCPYCERPVYPSDTRCPTCATKFIWWYINLILILLAASCVVLLFVENLAG